MDDGTLKAATTKEWTDAYDELSPEELNQIGLQSLVGKRTRFFRPPHQALNQAELEQVSGGIAVIIIA